MSYSFQTKRHLVFVMPFAGGGDMLTMMENECLIEESAHFYLCELVEGIGYLHEKRELILEIGRFLLNWKCIADIVHRDVKLENLLIGNDGHLMITDYGLSATGCDAEDAIQGVIGTRRTIFSLFALKKKSKPNSDVFSAGWNSSQSLRNRNIVDQTVEKWISVL